MMHIVNKQNPLLKQILNSLFEVVIEFNETSKYLPYYGSLTYDQNYNTLGQLSANVICLFAEFDPKDIQNADNIYEFQIISNFYQTSAIYSNQTFNYIRKMECNPEFTKNIIRLLQNPYKSNQSWLVNSHLKIQFHDQILYIIQKIIFNNDLFLKNILESQQALEFIQLLIVYFNEEFQNQSLKFNLIIFIFSKIFEDKQFCQCLNHGFENKYQIPQIPIFQGSIADALIISITYGILNFDYQQNSKKFLFQQNLMKILQNIIPYIVNISLISSKGLINLLKHYSDYSKLIQNNEQFDKLYSILDILDSALNYQPQLNKNLISIIFQHKNDIKRSYELKINKQVVSFILQKFDPVQAQQIFNSDANLIILWWNQQIKKINPSTLKQYINYFESQYNIKQLTIQDFVEQKLQNVQCTILSSTKKLISTQNIIANMESFNNWTHDVLYDQIFNSKI